MSEHGHVFSACSANRIVAARARYKGLNMPNSGS